MTAHSRSRLLIAVTTISIMELMLSLMALELSLVDPSVFPVRKLVGGNGVNDMCWGFDASIGFCRCRVQVTTFYFYGLWVQYTEDLVFSPFFDILLLGFFISRAVFCSETRSRCGGIKVIASCFTSSYTSTLL